MLLLGLLAGITKPGGASGSLRLDGIAPRAAPWLMASGGTSAPARGRREETWTGRAHRRQERRPRAGVGALNVATELRVLEPCLQPCWLCKEFDDEDDPHPIVPGTTVGHCAKPRLLWHEAHVCGPCQCAVDDVLAPRRLGQHQALIFEDEPASCRHLYHRGHRRAQLRAVALTKLRKGSDFPPCRDCSAAWLDATPSPRTSGLQATQK